MAFYILQCHLSRKHFLAGDMGYYVISWYQITFKLSSLIGRKIGRNLQKCTKSTNPVIIKYFCNYFSCDFWSSGHRVNQSIMVCKYLWPCLKGGNSPTISGPVTFMHYIFTERSFFLSAPFCIYYGAPFPLYELFGYTKQVFQCYNLVFFFDRREWIAVSLFTTLLHQNTAPWLVWTFCIVVHPIATNKF